MFYDISTEELVELNGGDNVVAFLGGNTTWGTTFVKVIVSFLEGVAEGFQYQIDHNPLAF